MPTLRHALATLVLVCTLGLVPTLAVGQDVAPPSAPPAPQPPAAAEPALAPVTRADIAQLYLRLERSLRDHPPADVATVNRAFDAASLQFFSGDFGRVARGLNTLRLRVEGAEQPADAFAASLTIQLDPPVLDAARAGPARLAVAPLYDEPIAQGARLMLLDGEGREVISRLIDGPRLAITVDLSELTLAAGQRLTAQIRVGGRVAFERHWPLLSGSLAARRGELLERLDRITSTDPALVQALASARARAALLQDQPSTTNSAEFLADPIVLTRALDAEVAALEAGRDPYRRTAGHLWRVVAVAGLDVPVRVYVPKDAAGDEPRPLILALHGAGGDESMFMEGYGLGVLCTLADTHRAIVVAPLTTMVMGNPRVIEAIIDALALTHAIDRSRVVMLGHSLGAGAAAGLASTRPELFAGVACLAGSPRFRLSATLPPTLVIAAELDPLAPAARVEQGLRPAIAAGLPITFRAKPNQGHTLVVGAVLPEVVEWLLAREPRPQR